ncbi:MAG TPA: ABC transporter substrate-binding protein [Gemmatimonadales bacterium]
MREAVRIVSFLPAGTEIVHALGAGADLLGRSHECDYPAEVARVPVVSRPALRLEGLGPEEVDRAVSERLKSGASLYEVDEALLRELSPDVILTQDLCQVCAPSGNELSRALRELPGTPRVIRLTPRSIAQIHENILEVGDAIGRRPAAEALVAENTQRIARVAKVLAGRPVRRVVFLEWIDPLFCAGHWVPEMIARAGGEDRLGKPEADSERINWEDVLETAPEIIVVAPCGYGLARATELGGDLPSVSNATVYAVDANAYFARPGPRVGEGVELLAHLFHPARFPWPHPGRPWAEIG